MNHEMYSSQIESRAIPKEDFAELKKPTVHTSVYKFRDIEDVIQLSHRLTFPYFDSKLYSLNSNYFLVVMYPVRKFIRGQDEKESLILEYGERGHTTIFRLEEYGRCILKENALAEIKKHFKQLV